MTVSNTFSFQVEAIVQVLRRAFDLGFQLPIYNSTVSVNGCMIFGRFDAGASGELAFTKLAEHTKPEGFVLPMNIVLMDSGSGDAIKVCVIQDSETKTEIVN